MKSLWEKRNGSLFVNRDFEFHPFSLRIPVSIFVDCVWPHNGVGRKRIDRTACDFLYLRLVKRKVPIARLGIIRAEKLTSHNKGMSHV
jgi:hypothetical protein